MIVTPTDSDRTEYIGNPACHGRMAAVFAQLVVAGDQHGVHALVMPLHDERGELLEAIPDAVLGAPIGLRDAAD